MSRFVCKASCWDYQDFYIGKTKRRLQDRKTEPIFHAYQRVDPPSLCQKNQQQQQKKNKQTEIKLAKASELSRVGNRCKQENILLPWLDKFTWWLSPDPVARVSWPADIRVLHSGIYSGWSRLHNFKDGGWWGWLCNRPFVRLVLNFWSLIYYLFSPISNLI